MKSLARTPLAAARLMKQRGSALFFALISLVVIMSLVGLWHGAGWPFLVWGCLHGLYLVAYRAWEAFARTKEGWTKQRYTRALDRVMTRLKELVAAESAKKQ